MEAKDEQKRLVVAGLGMVGVAFVAKLLERDLLQKKWQVTVLGEESWLAYNRVGLTEYFLNRSIPGLLLNDQSWYDNYDPLHLTYRISEPVISINRRKKSVDTKTTKNIPYDVLVLATGSSAVLPKALLPPLPTGLSCYDEMGVFSYRTIDDVQKIISWSERQAGGKALVVGGGLLGLEASKALYDLGTFDTIGLIHRSKWLLSQQLDDAGGLMLADKVRDLGIETHLGCEVSELIFTDNKLSAVRLNDGSLQECRLLIYAIGIRPRDELATTAGIETAPRGGVVVNDSLQSSDPSIYAIGECANWKNHVFGLIAPGVEMADVLSFNLTQAELHTPRVFEEPEVGTRLKLMGVDVASFGDYFADRNGPKKIPRRKGPFTTSDVVPLVLTDPFSGTYKKLIFSKDGSYLLGGILVGNISEFTKFSNWTVTSKKLDKSPSEIMVPASAANAEDDVDELDESAQVCSCNNVTKGQLLAKLRDGSASSVGELKSLTKAATACGGCEGTVKALFSSEMKRLGKEVSASLCPHFVESRADLFNKVMVKGIDSFSEVMRQLSRTPEANGCEICKPTIASILSSLYNRFVMDQKFAGLQETNDRFLGNIQRNGTYSVVPRVSAGEITPEKLIKLGQVARKYNLYTKITGGQRVDLFGAKKQDLPSIWLELETVGFESGHAYGKSLRTVKSCVGTTWCRFGIGDSVGMAVRLEERYKSVRSPHKIKGGVSGCIRDCAEFHNKDFGLCATKSGFSVYVGGNGGMRPAHAVLLQADVLPDRVIPLIDRYLMFYIRTADRLQRTARWLEALPGGVEYLKDVIINDKLGICDDLEQQMKNLVGSFYDEWAVASHDPETLKDFRQFANTSRTVETVEIVYERGQPRPADWNPDESASSATENFRGHKWSSVEWQAVCDSSDLPDLPAGSSTTVLVGDTQIALFRTREKMFASQNMCGHRRAFVLSQGILGSNDSGATYVSCPLHKRNYVLEGPERGSCSNSPDQSLATFDIKEDAGKIWVLLPPVSELDGLLSTSRWKVRRGEGGNQLKKLDDEFPMPLPQRVTCSDAELLAW